MASLKEEISNYIKEKYAAPPENLWRSYPDYAVFRHRDNDKWFAILMDVPRRRLGLAGEETADILNVKLSDPLLADVLSRQPGFLKAYHMSRGSWVSILLDGTVPRAELFRWLDESYLVTASREERQRMRPPKEWIIPANPKFYDVQSAFEAADEIDWKQGAGIKTGDTVYLYVAVPVSAVLYKCLVTETGIPYHLKNENVRIERLMRIKLLRRYSPDRFTFEILGKEYGIFAVRGPRGISVKLSEALNEA